LLCHLITLYPDVTTPDNANILLSLLEANEEVGLEVNAKKNSVCGYVLSPECRKES